MKNTFTIGICEDVLVEANLLTEMVKRWANHKEIPVKVVLYNCADQFWFHYITGVLDVVFLDIKMPGEDGMTLAKKLRKKGDFLPIIFVTGEREYLADGYDVEAVHYLLKPVNEDKLFQCLARIWGKLGKEEPYVLLQTNDKAVKLYQKDIYKIESFGHNLVYFTKQGEYQVTSSLIGVKDQLVNGWFVKCYRGVLVGIRHIDMIEKTLLILQTGENNQADTKLNRMVVPVSRRLYKEVNEAFISYHKGRLS